MLKQCDGNFPSERRGGRDYFSPCTRGIAVKRPGRVDGVGLGEVKVVLRISHAHGRMYSRSSLVSAIA